MSILIYVSAWEIVSASIWPPGSPWSPGPRAGSGARRRRLLAAAGARVAVNYARTPGRRANASSRRSGPPAARPWRSRRTSPIPRRRGGSSREVVGRVGAPRHSRQQRRRLGGEPRRLGRPRRRGTAPSRSTCAALSWSPTPRFPHLEKAQGSIVFVSSTAGQRGEAGHSAYAATKGALISYTKSLASELGPARHPRQLRRAGLGRDRHDAGRPSPIRTPAARSSSPIPLGRVAQAEDVAGPVLFLVSDLARHVQGEVLNVNGGSVLVG